MENVQAITIDTGNAQSSVKKLKEDISKLRDEILNLTKGTDEYDKTVKVLQDNQRKYNEVMSLTKKEATALEGSYDALVHQMSLLKKEWRATNDELKRNELGKQIDEINTKLKEFDASVGNHQRNVGNYTEGITDAFAQLKQEIKDARNALLQAEEGTDAYADAMKRLSDAQFQLRDMNEQSRYAVADFGEQLSNVVGITQGVAAGFSAFQSVMVLAGADTEEFEKVMVKLQATMALVQGLQGLEGLVDRVKGLTSVIKIASKSMGKAGWIGVILAVVGAIGSLVWWLKEKNEALDKGEQLIKNYNQALKENTTEYSKQVAEITVYNNLATDTNIALEKRLTFAEKLVTALGLENTELNKQKALNGELATEIDKVTDALMRQSMAKVALNLVAEEQEKLLKLQLDSIQIEQGNIPDGYATNIGRNMPVTKQIQARKEVNKAIDEVEASIQKVIDAAQQLGADFSSLNKDNNTSSSSTTTTTTTTTTTNANGYKETLSYIKDKEDRLTALKGFISDENLTLQERLEFLEQIKQLEVEIEKDKKAEKEKLRAEEINALKQNIEETNNAYDLAIREKLINGENPFDLQIEKIRTQIATLNELILNTDDADEREKLMWEKANLELDIIELTNEEKKRLREEDEENEKQHQAKLYNISMASMSALSNLFGAMADIYESDEKNAEKYAEEIKAFRITSAVIDTIQGAVSAFAGAMQLGPIAGPIVGALNAAAVTAMGIANINKIKNTKVGDKSANVDSNFNSSQVTPKQDYTQSNPFEYTRNVTTASEYDELNKESRVILVESDLTNALRKVQIRQNETSF